MENKEEGKRPIPVMDFDVKTPLDTKRGIETMCGNPTFYYRMLAQFEDMTFLNLMGEIAKEVNNGDMFKMMEAAHTLKSPAGYIAASRIHYACYFI